MELGAPAQGALEQALKNLNASQGERYIRIYDLHQRREKAKQDKPEYQVLKAQLHTFSAFAGDAVYSTQSLFGYRGIVCIVTGRHKSSFHNIPGTVRLRLLDGPLKRSQALPNSLSQQGQRPLPAP